ncbi:MAG TPA: flagellar hook protein FlgE [Sphingomonas sp.]|jgi:flagellar hook protein FlgE|nr:flagellar hook protein FlgE [Sphingomonas sp.]
MSLYSALFAGVSGLSSEASAMATAADNITNINTVGYKGTDAQFATLVGGSSSSKGTYSAGGVQMVQRPLISKEMLMTPTSNSTDLAIGGQGFFVTRTGTSADSGVALTRAGSFSIDEAGYLKNTAGLYLQGWRLDPAGNINNTGGVNGLESIRVNDLVGTASATTRIQLSANFKSTTANVAYSPAVAANAAATPAVAASPGDVGKMALYAKDPDAVGAIKPVFTRPLEVYDQQGGTHTLTLAVVKTADNMWQGEIYVTPPSDVVGGAATNGLISSGPIEFNTDGSLKSDTTQGIFGNIEPVWSNGAGSAPISLNLGTTGGFNGLTSFDDTSAERTKSVDGGKLGNIASIGVSKDGIVSAVFENGTTRKVFQLPVATVTNPDGLSRLNGNAFQVSNESGSMVINPPGSFGGGDVESFKLEASTTDLAQEFTNMIRFQRAYSASSKIITTVDDMLQEVSNLKR